MGCRALWAFYARSAIESLNGTHGKFRGFQYSQQYIIDCRSTYGTEGCDGGFMNQVFEYVKVYTFKAMQKYLYVGKDQTCMKTIDDYKFCGFNLVSIKSSAGLANVC